jgi:NAD(P)-dependent dehydrogenase (short-subunit alcohol dehydrogenase family)
MRDLNGKTAWITGAGTGFGRAAALSLAEEGMSVVLSGRRSEKLEEVAALIAEAGGPEAVIEALDVSDQAAVEQAAGRIKERFGRLDVLVNSAGINVLERYWDNVPTAEFDRVMAVNLNGAFYCTQAVLPLMRAQNDGLVIQVSSWAGRFHSSLSGPAYNASKAAMLSMSTNLNVEEGENGIRSCCVCPGEADTEILDARPVPVPQEERDKMLKAEDLGEIIRFLSALPPHVCVNELTVSPTWNRAYVGAKSRG